MANAPDQLRDGANYIADARANIAAVPELVAQEPGNPAKLRNGVADQAAVWLKNRAETDGHNVPVQLIAGMGARIPAALSV